MLKRFLRDLKTAALLWYEKDADLMAATVSYYALFAVTPLLLLTITLVGLVYGRELVVDTLLVWGSVLGTDIVALLVQSVGNLELLSNNFFVPIIGVLFFSGMTVLLFNTFTTGLHQLWGIPHQGFRGWVRKCLKSVAFVFILEFYLLCIVGVYQLIDWIGETNEFFFLVLGEMIVLFITAVLFSLMFRFLPWQYPSLYARFSASLVTSAFFTLAKFFVAVYVSLTPVPGLFGAAGVILALLIWIYVSASILYFGAALARVIDQRKRTIEKSVEMV